MSGALLALLALLGSARIDPAAAPAPAPLHGTAFHYHAGVFRAVAARRGMRLDPTAAGYASTPSCALVDPARPWWVRVRWADGTGAWLQIVDCSNPRDLPAQRRKHLVLEVNAALAQARGWYAYDGWGGAGHAPVTILGYRR